MKFFKTIFKSKFNFVGMLYIVLLLKSMVP